MVSTEKGNLIYHYYEKVRDCHIERSNNMPFPNIANDSKLFNSKTLMVIKL